MRRAACMTAVLLASPAAVWSAPDLHSVTDHYCTKCHNTEDWAGGLDLTSLDQNHVGQAAAEWEKVVLKLRAGMMPPPGEQRPSRQETEAFVQALEQRLDAEPTPPPVAPALHRLNRTEYTNAIRDIFGFKADVASLLPADDSSEGFDNVAAGLTISPALIQGYTNAAMKLARLAVGDMTTSNTSITYQARGKQSQGTRLAGLPLGSRGGMRVVHYFPLDAEYRISAGSGGFGAGAVASAIDVAIDGQRIASRGTVQVKAGSHVVTAAVFSARRSAEATDIYSAPRTETSVESIEIAGPFKATGPGDTESRRRIFSCYPRSPQDENACARQILLNVASQAFRGPQRPADLDVVMQFYERGHAEGGFEAGIQEALSRILIDPRFLFRFEAQSTSASGTISDLELASRLSFFLWSSIPDQPLIDLGVRGNLHQPEVLAAEVRRMLADPRAVALVDNFAGQWLYLRELAAVTPEDEGFDESLREGFIEETRALVNWVLAQDRPVSELLTADYSFLNERLAKHYGIDGVHGPEMRMVKLPPGTHRRGLLGQGSILTVTSTATRTSPVIRGAWILGSLLGAPPPNPPPGVETNIDGDGTQVITTSVRERLEQHRRSPSCAACHSVIDPVGFALENFNSIGAWRERDGDTRVDARGTLVDGTVVNGTDDLVAALMSRSQLFATNVTQKLMIYALGRALDYRDMPAVRRIVSQAGRDQASLGALILGVVQSPAFRQRGQVSEPVSVAAR